MIAALVVATLLSGAKSPKGPEMAFGYLDSAGKRLLALGNIDQPAFLTRASCQGSIARIKYLRRQPRGAKDTGRQTRFNFGQSEGHLFEVVDPLAPTDDTCLLGTAEFFAAREMLPLKPEKGACDEKTTAAAAAAVGRKVERCVKLGSFSGHGRLVAAHFERKGEEALAAVVLLDAGPTAVRAFRAKWDPEGISCWRVDDGCQFEPSVYKVPFALAGPSQTELFFLWDGAEGQNVALLRVGATIEPVLEGSRYWSPE